jgi:hypothetical protein
MPVIIEEVATEVVVEPGAAPARGRGEPEAAVGGEPPFEVQIEALRPLVRELLAEEIERHLRTALPPR